ncbi:MAG: hypothetical protein AUF79_02845 [Crenarchaeota archaeon 13_1_20CM_2_51_8]|nr:MAG: hypothetical protein AUF79_02845 [Crenarchaeota archaeon 13_1_20CM_2_51_8]
MAFVFSDIEVVAALATILVVVYFLGTYYKHRILKRYAHWFEERFSPKARVKFASFGHAGLRIKCEMNSSSDGFKELEFALTLGARENLIYYPYSLITRDSDRLNCWATLTDPVKFQVEITRLKKKVKLTWETAGIEEVKIPQLSELGYRVYSKGVDFANQLVDRSDLVARLKDLNTVDSLMLEEEPSRLHLVAKLHIDELAKTIDLISLVGRSI